VLDSMPGVQLVATSRWEGAESRLYKLIGP
jgi:hypothetical protein